MGIPGMQTFVLENGLLVEHHLRRCTLLIDGLNFENDLYRHYLGHLHAEKEFGGDYAAFAAYIEAFFRALARCQVTPVVIMEGAFEDAKRSVKVERFEQRLDTARAIYAGEDTRGEDINSLLNSYMFEQVLRKLGITLYKSIREAKDVLSTIASDLGATLLSSDGDLLLEHLPAGLILTTDFLAANEERIFTETISQSEDSSSPSPPYLKCRLYFLQKLLALIPGGQLKAEMLPVAVALLNRRHFDEAKKLISTLPRLGGSYHNSKLRQLQIYTVLCWLASQSSPSSAKEYLISISSSSHPIVVAVEERLLKRQQVLSVRESLSGGAHSVADYFKVNYEALFSRPPGVPRWAHDSLVRGKMPKRAMSLFLGQVEFFRPLVEDFSLHDSSYKTVFKLCDYIYGLLRSDDISPKAIDRYVRVGDELACQKVAPKTKIGDDRLPMLADIAAMSERDRMSLLTRILDMSVPLSTDVKKFISTRSSGIRVISAKHLTQLQSLVFASVYLCQHFPTDLSIDFLYALLVNMLFMGYFSSSSNSSSTVSNTAATASKLLEFGDKSAEVGPLKKKLAVFDRIPLYNSTNYQARIVHQYNAWQNCLHNINFLASVLDLSKYFHADTLVCGLQGTFLYNLALELARQSAPLSYLRDTLLGPGVYPVFEAFLRLVLDNCKRSFVGDSGGVLPTKMDDDKRVSKAAIPVISSAAQKKPGERYFVRGSSSPSATVGGAAQGRGARVLASMRALISELESSCLSERNLSSLL